MSDINSDSENSKKIAVLIRLEADAVDKIDAIVTKNPGSTRTSVATKLLHNILTEDERFLARIRNLAVIPGVSLVAGILIGSVLFTAIFLSFLPRNISNSSPLVVDISRLEAALREVQVTSITADGALWVQIDEKTPQTRTLNGKTIVRVRPQKNDEPRVELRVADR